MSKHQDFYAAAAKMEQALANVLDAVTEKKHVPPKKKKLRQSISKMTIKMEKQMVQQKMMILLIPKPLKQNMEWGWRSCPRGKCFLQPVPTWNKCLLMY